MIEKIKEKNFFTEIFIFLKAEKNLKIFQFGESVFLKQKPLILRIFYQ